MAISFLQDDIDLTDEQWNIFRDNIESDEFEVPDLGTFSFKGEGTPELDSWERNYGVMKYSVQDLDNECFYLFKVDFYFTDHYELSDNNKDYTLEAVSSTASLKY